MFHLKTQSTKEQYFFIIRQLMSSKKKLRTLNKQNKFLTFAIIRNEREKSKTGRNIKEI